MFILVCCTYVNSYCRNVNVFERPLYCRPVTCLAPGTIVRAAVRENEPTPSDQSARELNSAVE